MTRSMFLAIALTVGFASLELDGARPRHAAACSPPSSCGSASGSYWAFDDGYVNSSCNCPGSPNQGRCHQSGSSLSIVSYYQSACLVDVDASWSCSTDGNPSYLEYINSGCGLSAECKMAGATSSWTYSGTAGDHCSQMNVSHNYSVRIVLYYYNCGTCSNCEVLRSHGVFCD